MSETEKNRLLVWGRLDALNVQKVMWLVGELKLPHQHISVGGRFGGLETPEFLAMNPHGRIPVVSDQGHSIWESHTILRYLAATHGQRLFWSESPFLRSEVERWMDWQQTALQPDFLTGVFWNYYRTPAKQRKMSEIRLSISRSNQHFSLLDTVLKKSKTPFLCGDALSLADIAIGTILYRYFQMDIERPSIPYVEAWYQRLQNRPAYQAYVMVRFDHMKEDLGKG